jgi:hypothetical protein
VVLTVVLANGTLNALAVADVVTVAAVEIAAVPVVFWFSVGMSDATTALNVGTPAEPLGAAKNVLAV